MREWRRLVTEGLTGLQLRLRGVRLPASLSQAATTTSLLLNQATGYDKCEALKGAVHEADQQYQQLRTALTQSRSGFAQAIANRSACQKDLNSLLQRKQSWNDGDLLRFTELYRAEMRLEQEESAAKQANERLEQAVDEAHARLMEALRERYQGEQLWSDKIRRASTLGTVALMLANLGLFLALQLWVEPRKRRLLLADFEARLAHRLSALQPAGKDEESKKEESEEVWRSVESEEVVDWLGEHLPEAWQPWWHEHGRGWWGWGVGGVERVASALNPWMVSTLLACLLALRQ